MTGATQTVGPRGIGNQVIGDGNTVVIRTGDVELRLERRHAPAAAPKSEAQLLRVNARVTTLVGRDTDLAALQAWLVSNRGISFRCVTGPGGSGKTRLAVELCEQAEQSGFDAGFAPYNGFKEFVERAAGWQWDRPTLVVIDDAAALARELRNWVELLAAREISSETPKLRLLLLERQANQEFGWWAELIRPVGFAGSGPEDLADPDKPIELSQLSIEDRRALLGQTMQLAGSLAGMQSAPHPPAAGEDPAFDKRLEAALADNEPLYLMMAGTEAIRRGAPWALALSGTALAGNAEAAERARLTRLAAEFGVAAPLFCHLAMCITLQNGCNAAMAEQLVQEECAAMGFPLTTPAGEIVSRLFEALPGSEGASVDALRPDLIGEAFLLRGMAEHRLFPARQEAIIARAWARTGMPVAAKMVGTVQDFAQGDAKHPSVAWLTGLAKRAQDLEAMSGIASAIPWNTLALRELAAAVQTAIVDALVAVVETKTGWRALLALERYALANRLGALGQHEAALAAAKAAVADFSTLAETDERFRPDLARSLGALAASSSATGQREEAVQASDQAVALFRALAESAAGSSQAGLAQALHLYGNMLSAVGRREEALAATAEAVQIRRDIVGRGDQTARGDLASSLNDLASRLSEVGRNQEAKSTAEEALALLRDLAARNPDSYTELLAMATSTLANRLLNLNLYSDAIGPASESAEVYRRLATARPAAFQPDFAGLLNNLATVLIGLNRNVEALAAADEAVGIGRLLIKRNAVAFGKFLARPLYQRAGLLLKLGRTEDAVVAGQEAVEVFRPIADNNPAVFRDELASALTKVSECQDALKLYPAALESAKEAAKLRRLDSAKGGQALFELALCLKTLTLRNSALQKWEAALLAADEAVCAWCKLTGGNPFACGVEPAIGYAMKATILKALGRLPEVAEAYAGAIAVLAPIFHSQPLAVVAMMQSMIGEYVSSCERISTNPDMVLLEPIFAGLKSLAAQNEKKEQLT